MFHSPFALYRTVVVEGYHDIHILTPSGTLASPVRREPIHGFSNAGLRNSPKSAPATEVGKHWDPFRRIGQIMDFSPLRGSELNIGCGF
jgi:hypothetical protein